MRKSLALLVLLLPALAACEPERHVTNNGVDYYDANTLAVDSMPSQPYTRGGQYYVNPEEATNTRDNRGMRSGGYGHNTDDDFRQTHPSTTITTLDDGTVVETTRQ
jgi:hypothetical protein